MSPAHVFVLILVLPALSAHRGRPFLEKFHFKEAEGSQEETPPTVDVTSVVERKVFQDSGYKCCCDKKKSWKDEVRASTRGTVFAGWCSIVFMDKCGTAKIVRGTKIAHDYKDTDGTCNVHRDEVQAVLTKHGSPGDAEKLLREAGAPKDYCMAASVKLQSATAAIPSATLDEEIHFACSTGSKAPEGKSTVKCEYESFEKGSFTKPHCEEAEPQFADQICRKGSVARQGLMLVREDRPELALYFACHDEKGSIFEVCFYMRGQEGKQICKGASQHLQAIKLAENGEATIPLKSKSNVGEETSIKLTIVDGKLKDGRLTLKEKKRGRASEENVFVVHDGSDE